MKKVRYESAEGAEFPSNVDPVKLQEELNANFPEEGDLTPEALLEWATQHRDSEIAKCLEWDDEKAAELYFADIPQTNEVDC